MVSELIKANADDFLGVSDVLVENMVRDCLAKRWAVLMLRNMVKRCAFTTSNLWITRISRYKVHPLGPMKPPGPFLWISNIFDKKRKMG